jgi:hypothetical protein
MKLIMSLLFLFSVKLFGQYNINDQKDLPVRLTSRQALKISDLELGISLGLIGTGILLPRIIKENRQGLEIPCIVFGGIIFIESRRLHKTVFDPRTVRRMRRFHQ